MDEQYIRENDVIDRYIRNRLEEEELAEFEILLLDSAELFKEVQFAETMHRGFSHSATSKELSSNRKNLTANFFRHWIQQPLSMAASIGLTVSVILLLMGLPTQPAFEQAESLNIASNLLLEPIRGPEERLTRSGISPILFTVDVGPDAEETTYDVKILDESTNEVIVSLGQAKVDSEGWLRFVVDRSLSGNHTVIISWRDTESRVDSYFYLLDLIH